MKHLKRPDDLVLRGGLNSPLNIIDHLPLENLFFDSRHWNIWKTCEIAPTVTTRTDACSQQYLFEIHEIDNAEIWRQEERAESKL